MRSRASASASDLPLMTICVESPTTICRVFAGCNEIRGHRGGEGSFQLENGVIGIERWNLQARGQGCDVADRFDSVFAAAAPQETTIAPSALASVAILSIAPSIKTMSLRAAIASTASRNPEALEGPAKSYSAAVSRSSVQQRTRGTFELRDLENFDGGRRRQQRRAQ